MSGTTSFPLFGYLLLTTKALIYFMTSLVPGAIAPRIANLIATFVPFFKTPKPVVMYDSVSIPYDYYGAWSWWQKTEDPTKSMV